MSLYRIVFDGQELFVEASRLARAEEAWLSAIRAEPDNSDFNEEPDSIELLSSEPVVRDGETPCPTPTGASADTGVTDASDTGTAASVTAPRTYAPTDASPTITASAPVDPEAVKNIRLAQSVGASWNEWVPSVNAFGLLAAYDAERAKLARIAAILSDPMLTDRQANELALRVERGEA